MNTIQMEGVILMSSPLIPGYPLSVNAFPQDEPAKNSVKF